MNKEVTISIRLKLTFLIRRTTDEQSMKMATKFEEKRASGRLGRCSSLLVYDTIEAHVTENVKVRSIRKRKLQISTNFSRIDRSSLTHSVP